MAKTQIVLAPDLHDHVPRRGILPILSLLILVPLALPLITDAAVLCYARWCEMLEKPVDVRTPTIDFLADTAASIRASSGYYLTSCFSRVPWSPWTVIPTAIGVMAVSMFFLRR